MSIQTELTRLTNAKAAIKAAIEGKGVTVPDATLLDGMAPLIESIQAGEGGKFASGTITSAANISLGPDANFEIETGFLNESGEVNFVLLLLNGSVSSAQNNTHFIGRQKGGDVAIAYKTVSNTSARYDTMYYDAKPYFKYNNTTGVVTLSGKSSSQILNTYYGNSKISWAIWVD